MEFHRFGDPRSQVLAREVTGGTTFRRRVNPKRLADHTGGEHEAFNPLEPIFPHLYVPGVDLRESDDDGDVEVFERIPWDSLKPPPDRRWLAYLAALGIVLAAVGVSIGRGMSPGMNPPVATSIPAAVTTLVPLAEFAEPTAPLPEDQSTVVDMELSGVWSEADLMAVPFSNLEASAATLAEWFIVDWFTRDGTAGSIDGRSFVEWSGVSKVEWLAASRVEVTVVVRRLAAVDDEPYTRLAAEAWVVNATIDGDEWLIDEGPVLAPTPQMVFEISPLDEEVPQHLVSSIGGDPTTATRVGDGWLVELDWVDPAGLTWSVRQRITDPES